MIAIETMEGELVKVLTNIKNTNFGVHQLFGLISEERAKQRIQHKKMQGHEFINQNWLCHFKIEKSEDGWKLISGSGCESIKLKDNQWKLSTPIGDFKFTENTSSSVSSILLENDDRQNWMNRLVELTFLTIFLLTPILLLINSEPIETKDEKEKESEKITVKIIKPQNTVNIARTKKSIQTKPLTQKQKSHRAVRRNLGFLGLVGSSNIKNVTGGVPQKLKIATAGAGKGGDAGSGGELLAGLGKGLKKTTVGNTGVSGLGGIGTKGAGGGKGGYGNTLVASGEGNGISAISVSSNEIVLDGGLSRYAINATIAKYLNQVRRCYENELVKNSALEGMVTVNFEVNSLGVLNFSRVIKTSLGNKAVEKCITTKMMAWKFPKPKGGTSVNINYPFMLRPVGQ